MNTKRMILKFIIEDSEDVEVTQNNSSFILGNSK